MKLTEEYKRKKSEIKKRLKDFKAVWKASDKRIFSELCFCICTPQSKALLADAAITRLERNGFLLNGNLKQIRAGLGGVRFPNNKARYILLARGLFTEGGSLKIKAKINTNDIPSSREWLVKNVKGIGFKEASHFLRNIGFGDDLAILDVHILKNMVKYGILKEVPKGMSQTAYLDIEEKLRKFSKKAGIPMAELDLLFWSGETGKVFK